MFLKVVFVYSPLPGEVVDARLGLSCEVEQAL